MSTFNILAIDYDDPDAPAQFVKSLHETGFAVLKGHPISEAEISQMYDCWADFFARADRHEFATDADTMHGYYGYKSENAKDSTFKDLKEFYHVYQNSPVPSDVEQPTRQFHQKLLDIGIELLGWIDRESPATVQDGFSEPAAQMVTGSEQNLLRVLHYPPFC
ncbi:MAG: 2-oxoglutarate and iron-dependent oxygenase domain-containing protein [Rhizobiales bacterium]|nr:2-oxoglutarate and iron-dependent oxygenase domain-containing protein [Hyphomicrobiales bacterium]